MPGKKDTPPPHPSRHPLPTLALGVPLAPFPLPQRRPLFHKENCHHTSPQAPTQKHLSVYIPPPLLSSCLKRSPQSQAPCLLSLQISFSICSFAQLKTWPFVSYFKKRKRKRCFLSNTRLLVMCAYRITIQTLLLLLRNPFGMPQPLFPLFYALHITYCPTLFYG